MKTEDFERLKAICEKEGFELLKSLPDKDTNFHILAVSKKDIWYGVEFAESTGYGPIGNIFKIESSNDHDLQYRLRKNGCEGKLYSYTKKAFKPSTESAYIEQLKKEAFERFGEIKDGQKFKDWEETVFEIHDTGFLYSKRNDQLRFGGWIIYQQGKWAERVKERLSGEYVRYHILWPKEDGATLGYSFKGFANKEGVLPIDKLEDAGKFLAKQLESYLNLEKHEIIGYGDVISIHLKVDNNKMHNFERIKEAVVKFAEELK